MSYEEEDESKNPYHSGRRGVMGRAPHGGGGGGGYRRGDGDSDHFSTHSGGSFRPGVGGRALGSDAGRSVVAPSMGGRTALSTFAARVQAARWSKFVKTASRTHVGKQQGRKSAQAAAADAGSVEGGRVAVLLGMGVKTVWLDPGATRVFVHSPAPTQLEKDTGARFAKASSMRVLQCDAKTMLLAANAAKAKAEHEAVGARPQKDAADRAFRLVVDEGVSMSYELVRMFRRGAMASTPAATARGAKAAGSVAGGSCAGTAADVAPSTGGTPDDPDRRVHPMPPLPQGNGKPETLALPVDMPHLADGEELPANEWDCVRDQAFRVTNNSAAPVLLGFENDADSRVLRIGPLRPTTTDAEVLAVAEAGAAAAV